MLALMVCGLFSKLAFPYAQFSCASMTGDLLRDPVWEAISRLEQQGIHVLTLICDGTSVNRGLWNYIHGDGGEIVHKVDVFALEVKHPILFVSDPPHLQKTL